MIEALERKMISDSSGAVGSAPTLACYLLARLKGLYPGKVSRVLRDGDVVLLWHREMDAMLTARRATSHQIDSALEVVVATMEWPPLDVEQWVKLLSPVRDFEQAFREAQLQAHRRHEGLDRWSHPAIFWAAERFGWWDVRNASWESAGRRWSEVLIEVLSWPHWPPIKPLMIPTEKRLQTKAAASKAMAAAREILAESARRRHGE